MDVPVSFRDRRAFPPLRLFDKLKWNSILHMLVYVQGKANCLYVTVCIVFNLVSGLSTRWHNGNSYINSMR
jgi:hypothetical protein